MLAFVEGSMERQFVSANFKYVNVVPVHNGITWSTDQLCKKISSDFKASNFNGPVFVWLDREGRTELAAEIREAILSSLIEAGGQQDNIHVMINDRMSENFILSDEQVIREEFELPTYEYDFEGQNGKYILKKMHRDIGINYKEMVHGARLLKKVRIERASIKSPSVQLFLSNFFRECWWR